MKKEKKKLKVPLNSFLRNLQKNVYYYFYDYDYYHYCNCY